MANDWIDNLANDIRQKNRDAAQEYGRSQHYAGLIETHGRAYFLNLVSCLQENIDALRSRLQGDAVSSEMAVKSIKPDEIRITRARFPWVDARLTHSGDAVSLDYAKAPGLGGDPELNRETRAYAFRIGEGEKLTAEDAFNERPQVYAQATDLARHITELLFEA